MSNTQAAETAGGNRADAAKSLQRALTILECIAQHPSGVTVKQLSQELGMNKPIICKILQTFEENEYVSAERTAVPQYRLGTKILLLSHQMTRSLDLLTVARPVMIELNTLTDESVNLAIYSEAAHELVYISTIDGNHKLRLTNGPGMKPVLTSSAVGKALLAALPEEERRIALEHHPIQPRTRHSIRTVAELYERLPVIAEQGYAVANEETIEGVIGVGTVIYGVNRRIIGSIAITGPKTRIPEETVRRYGTLVSEAARRISLQMGWYDDENAGPAPSVRR